MAAGFLGRMAVDLHAEAVAAGREKWKQRPPAGSRPRWRERRCRGDRSVCYRTDRIGIQAYSLHRKRRVQGEIMNKDQVKGRIEEVKGEARKVAGKMSGNKKLERKGTIQNVSGKIQAGYGDLKEDLKNKR
jgi:uncharacterized protein YjbJ (UPF0337 family)